MKKIFTIKEYREFLGISQASISNTLGISQAAYSKIESKENLTNKSRYAQIANILGVDLEHVLTNQIEIVYIIRKSEMNYSEADVNIVKTALEVIEQNIFILNKIYNQSNHL